MEKYIKMTQVEILKDAYILIMHMVINKCYFSNKGRTNLYSLFNFNKSRVVNTRSILLLKV